MSVSLSHDFDDKNYALLRLMKNDAFLRLKIKEIKLIFYKYCFNKSLLKFVFKFGLRMNKKSAFNF